MGGAFAGRVVADETIVWTPATPIRDRPGQRVRRPSAEKRQGASFDRIRRVCDRWPCSGGAVGGNVQDRELSRTSASGGQAAIFDGCGNTRESRRSGSTRH